MAKTKIPLPFSVTTADPGPKPAAVSDNSVPNQQAWLAWQKNDRDNKESQPAVVSDGGKGVSN
ncbi:MAG: hypothetical protein JWQ87_2655 [Candidatus Sulfotelmatobacter sp.]|nr:hypothetical protein [Candidatus Sulfotelmatobacter sp.]